MIWHPTPGQRVRLHYRQSLMAVVLYHDQCGTVEAAAIGPGPVNALVVLDDGRRVVVPRGNMASERSEMQRCEYRDDCLHQRFPGGRAVCPCEEDDGVETCRHRQLMPCGHPRLYLRWAPSQFSQTTVWCSKCEEEQGSDGRADKTWHDDDGPEM